MNSFCFLLAAACRETESNLQCRRFDHLEVEQQVAVELLEADIEDRTEPSSRVSLVKLEAK